MEKSLPSILKFSSIVDFYVVVKTQIPPRPCFKEHFINSILLEKPDCLCEIQGFGKYAN